MNGKSLKVDWKYLKYSHLYDLGYTTSDTPRMFCYLWDEVGIENECKFGERWVLPGQNPVEECLNRIRESIGVRKDIFDSGNINVPMIWDVTDYSIKVDKFKKNGKVDDEIRKHIGFRKGTVGEVHSISSQAMRTKVSQFLTNQNQKRPIVRLSTAQYDVLSDVVTQINLGKRRFLLELCARFGKTIKASALPIEINTQLMVITSYVKTVFTSFQNDVQTYEQFKDIVEVEADDLNYQQKVTNAINEGKRVFVYLSLVKGSKREDRVKFLCGLDVSRMVIVDEGDFGAHQPAQAEIISNNIKEDDVLIVMTGTNADRASSIYDIDYPKSVPYFQLLVDKRESFIHKMAGKNMISNSNRLRYFERDKGRDLLYPSVQGYQMDLISSVSLAIECGLVSEGEFTKLPSWQKFVQNPIKAKGWYVTLLEALFKGKHNLNELNVDFQTNSIGGRRVAMMFLPDNSKKENITKVVNITSELLSDYIVIELSGNVTTQKNAEKLVKETMELNPTKSILIISAKMAQRSFSIPLITELYLCYDRGQNGATIQKMSRALTPNGMDKVGKILSLSFDSNRDDKFDTLIVQTALNLIQNGGNMSDINTEIRRVLNSIDIFSCTDDGAMKMNIDDFVESSLQRKTISRVMGMKTDINGIPTDIIDALVSGNTDYIKNVIREAAKTGKTFEKIPTKSKNKAKASSDKSELKKLEKVRQVLTTIYENSDILMRVGKYLGANNIRESFKVFESKGWQSMIGEEFGLEYDVIKYLFESGRINENWINILHK
jgi:hypothetical protein